MNLEDLAKHDLMQFEIYEPLNLYDPYRKKNVLKDSNTNAWDSQQIIPHFTNHKIKQFSKQKRQSFKQKQTFESDRHSLKMLLMKLQSVPSPDKKPKTKKTIKLKTIGEMSSTECIAVVKKNKSILIKLDSQNKVQDLTQQKLNLNSLSRPITTQKRGKTKLKNISESFRPNEQQRVRNLIKQKLAQKQKKQSKQKVLRILDPKIFGSNRVF